MSSYSSLFRVLSPSRVQTKFEENFLPARYTTSIMAFCFVVGTEIENTFEVEGWAGMSISKLKEIIYEKNENDFKSKSIDANKLYLWKVDIPCDTENVKLKTLESRSHDINNENTTIQELGGKKLKPIEKLGNIFNNDSENIRIIAQPPLPATTGKRRLEYDWSEDRDRKKGKLSVPEAILNRAKKIMEDIKKLPENPEDYSNPKKFLSLPFPFLGERKPVERFSINDDDKFMYMGRKAFVNVLNTIYELKRGCGYMDCFIYGTIGYGKSYILATIVCFLLRTGRRVVYLPDCRELAKKPENYIKLALYLAYTDDIKKINEIFACKTFDDIIAFCESSEPLYFIVDQMNALDHHNNTEIVEEKKATILDVLNRMTSEHYYIKSSSANNESALYLIQKQTNDRRIELYGGLDEDEMSQWWMQNRENLPSVNEEQKKKIEHDTGKNPLFLSFLLGIKENFENHLNQLLKEKIKKPMTNFSEMISKSERWDLHIKLMTSFLTNGLAPSGHGVNDYDHRYFYITHDECCHCISGYARDQMADYLFQKGNLEIFTDPSWIRCIREFRNNPSVMGFMVEKACLSSIYKNGLIADAINFKFNDYKFFSSIKEINLSMNEGPCTFYLPRCWNQKSIDGLITFYKMKNKKEKVEEDTLYIAPIQITLDKETHSNSEASFFSGIWPVLESKISDGLKVKVIFIWITRENDVDHFVKANKKILKERTIEINPQYTSVVIAFRCINIDLEDILSN